MYVLCLDTVLVLSFRKEWPFHYLYCILQETKLRKTCRWWSWGRRFDRRHLEYKYWISLGGGGRRGEVRRRFDSAFFDMSRWIVFLSSSDVKKLPCKGNILYSISLTFNCLIKDLFYKIIFYLIILLSRIIFVWGYSGEHFSKREGSAKEGEKIRRVLVLYFASTMTLLKCSSWDDENINVLTVQYSTTVWFPIRWIRDPFHCTLVERKIS